MSIEVSEKEMLFRFTDGLSKSASAAKQLLEPMNIGQPKALNDFLHGLKISAGSAHQLGIYRENLGLLDVRDSLERIIEEVQEMSAEIVSGNPVWNDIKKLLEKISVNGIKLAESKPMSRKDVLANLDYMQRNPKTIN